MMSDFSFHGKFIEVVSTQQCLNIGVPIEMKWRLAGGMSIQLAAAVFCMLPLFTSSTGDIRHHGTSRARGWRGGVQPSADVTANNTVSNITAQLGGTAYLHCLVGHLSERGQVSWIRKRDWHILSSGKFTYTNDERFQVLHGEGSEDWTLQIKFVQKRDNGTYECQVRITVIVQLCRSSSELRLLCYIFLWLFQA
ncbi:unnamed protein product [Arctia plantaginis]|uniref:Ig-like domain-containing protein n=1 Tax=Arctia plantaginis TaxID=874455 RepID=A0A8S1AAP2_ARCPL|nr:unnamed protein product [Arctia plantaginis]